MWYTFAQQILVGLHSQQVFHKLTAKDSCHIAEIVLKVPSFINRQQEIGVITIFPPLDFSEMPSPLELKDTLKIMHLEKIDSFTHTQIALLASQSKITPHKLFPYRNTIIAILVTISIIGLCIIGKCIFNSVRTCGRSNLLPIRVPGSLTVRKPTDSYTRQVSQG